MPRRQLNEFGDPPATTYVAGVPLGLREGTDRYDHVMRHRPDIAIECSRAPGEPER